MDNDRITQAAKNYRERAAESARLEAAALKAGEAKEAAWAAFYASQKLEQESLRELMNAAQG